MKETKDQEKNKKDFIFIISTANSLEEARRLSELLVKEKAAACVSISSPVLSVYRWRDNVESEREVMLFIKTVKGNYGKVEKMIRENHSYEVPEIVALPIVAGEKHYLQWINDNSGGTAVD